MIEEYKTPEQQRESALEDLNKLTGRMGGLSYAELGLWVVRHISIIRKNLEPTS